MRLSLVVVLCLLIVVAHSATTKATSRRTAVTTRPATSKAPVPKSAYAYLRSIRGKNSCSGGTCPFWERHGRSFAALRCYSREYQDCTCLHRMCFSSCIFTKEVCNQEMVQCLRQICPRCMPASAVAMCSVYDSMAERVAEALSVFSCYQCCPMTMNAPGGNSSSPLGVPSTTPPLVGLQITTGIVPAAAPAGLSTTVPANGGAGEPAGAVNGEPAPVEGGPANGGAGLAPEPIVEDPSRNKRVQKTVRTTKRVVTTRRTPTTARRTAAPASTVRANKVKNVVPSVASGSKKPQVSNRTKS